MLDISAKQVCMRLNKNERMVLKLLLENSKLSDSSIALRLKISSQAVGKIRRKLEETVINSYTLDLHYEKLGISTFSIAFAHLTHRGIGKGEKEIERKLHLDPHIIQIFRLPGTDISYIILYGFRDMNECDSYFHSLSSKQDIRGFLEHKEVHTFSHQSLVKNSPNSLFHKMIDSLGDFSFNPQFKTSLPSFHEP